MYFGNYGFQNTLLHKYLKSSVSEDYLTGKWETVRKTFSISAKAPLPYSLINVKVIELGKRSFSAMENLNTVC